MLGGLGSCPQVNLCFEIELRGVFCSLAWPDRFFPFFFVVAEKRVWSGLQMHLVLTPSNVLINCIINTLV